MSDVMCSVCKTGYAVGSVYSSLGPVLNSYCYECIQGIAEPYRIVVVTTALEGGPDKVSDDMHRIIDASLDIAGKDHSQFISDVQDDIEEFCG